MIDNLISVTIADGITEIGDKAFALCENLETVTIPESIISISGSAFSLCDKLTLVVKRDSYASKYAQENEIPFIIEDEYSTDFLDYEITTDGTIRILGFNTDDIPQNYTLIIPAQINNTKIFSLGEKSFALNENITSVIIHEGISNIEKKAFALCENLDTVQIPSSVNFISPDAFSGCENVLMVVEPGSYSEEYAKNNNISYQFNDGSSPVENIDEQVPSVSEDLSTNENDNLSFESSEDKSDKDISIPNEDDAAYIEETAIIEDDDEEIENSDISIYLFDTVIGKSKSYVKKYANQFVEQDGVYIIDTSETNDYLAISFNENDEAEFVIWNYGKKVDAATSSDITGAVLIGSLRLGLLASHETEKAGSVINNQLVITYTDDIVCVYDFSQNCTAKCGYSSSFPESVSMLSDNIWGISHYVDEFGFESENEYIYNTKTIKGTFNNSATSKSEVEVALLIDKNDIAFMLYEYGWSKVKNSYSKNNENYKIIMLDSNKNRKTLYGKMYPNGDRIFVDFLYKSDVLKELKQNKTLSFYIEESSRPSTNYTFTIPDNHGFSETYKILTGEVDYPEKEESNSSVDDSKPFDNKEDNNSEQTDNPSWYIKNNFDIGSVFRKKPSLNGEVIMTLKNGTKVIPLGEQKEADKYLWIKVQTENGLTGWVNNAHVRQSK